MPTQVIPPMSRRNLLITTLAGEAALLALGALLMWWTDLWPMLGANPIDLGLGLIVGTALAGIAIALMRSSTRIFDQIRRDFDQFINLFAPASVVDLIIISILAGVCEEALFRGFLQTWIATLASPHIAILIAASIFGLTHAISRPYVVFVTVLGLVLGYLYYFTGSLIAVMLAHAAYDLIALYWGVRVYRPHGESLFTE